MHSARDTTRAPCLSPESPHDQDCDPGGQASTSCPSNHPSSGYTHSHNGSTPIWTAWWLEVAGQGLAIITGTPRVLMQSIWNAVIETDWLSYHNSSSGHKLTHHMPAYSPRWLVMDNGLPPTDSQSRCYTQYVMGWCPGKANCNKRNIIPTRVNKSLQDHYTTASEGKSWECFTVQPNLPRLSNGDEFL